MQTGPKKKPHILLLIDDEHRADVLPIEGDSIVRTPTELIAFGGGGPKKASTPDNE